MVAKKPTKKTTAKKAPAKKVVKPAVAKVETAPKTTACTCGCGCGANKGKKLLILIMIIIATAMTTLVVTKGCGKHGMKKGPCPCSKEMKRDGKGPRRMQKMEAVKTATEK